MQPERFTSAFIGEQSLLILCAEHVLSRGHVIRGVATESDEIRNWAAERSIPVVSSRGGGLSAVLAEQPCDYLFSVTNFRVLPEDVVRLARREAVNFHDGPLPQYAGLRVTTWALINGEPAHGVSWHRITREIDGGDVLKEKRFRLAADETAFTLNTKCYDAGFETFRELVADLEQGTAAPRAPGGDVPTGYFGKRKRPTRMAALDWSRPAEELDALVRGLDFGPYENPIGCPKVIWGDAILVPRRFKVLEQAASRPAGTVERTADSHVIRVHTASRLIEFGDLQTLDGQAVEVSALPELTGPGPESCRLNGQVSESLDALWERVCIHEPFWVERLTQRDPASLPYLASGVLRDARPANRIRCDVAWPGPNRTVTDAVATVALYLGRLSGRPAFDVDFRGASLAELPHGAAAYFAGSVPLPVRLDWNDSFAVHAARCAQSVAELEQRRTYARDLVLRSPQITEEHRAKLRETADVALVVQPGSPAVAAEFPAAQLLIAISTSAGEPSLSLLANPEALDDTILAKIAGELSHLLEQTAAVPETRLSDFSIVTPREQAIVDGWNAATKIDYEPSTLPRIFEAQVERTPGAPALVFRGESLTFAELNIRANRLAHLFISRGVKRGDLVGVLMDRSPDLVAVLLAVLKTGAAYVPMDAEYPARRLAIMAEDSQAAFIVTYARHVAKIEAAAADKILLDGPEALVGHETGNPAVLVEPGDRAYVMYTSGSTGRPKGVMITHKNITNFLLAMDEQLKLGVPDTWLAITSISFDISVVELFWTLTRGFRVVLYRGASAETQSGRRSGLAEKKMDFSLFFWNVAAADDSSAGEPYRLMLEAARFADEHEFCAVWTPERHFGSFGGFYPNPSVTGAAIAAITRRVGIRAGSCVLPLHHPIRVAEEWSVVDNLSNGRVGLSMASGWMPDDFVIRPENHAQAKSLLFDALDQVQRLWRGEAVSFPGPKGPVAVRTLPRPVQAELPVWITTAGNPETFRRAAQIGANVLTHLLGQSVDTVAKNIALYRKTWQEAGHAGEGRVTLMLHTLVGEDEAAVKEAARGPMKAYLKSALSLVRDAAWEFPTFKKMSEEAGKTLDEFFATASENDLGDLLEFAFERYFHTSGLFGTPERCLAMVDRLKEIGVDEIGCLIDFGMPADQVLAHLPALDGLRQAANPQAPSVEAEDMAGLIERHGVGCLQCTPSMAASLTWDERSRRALSKLSLLLVGGEPLSEELARQLRSIVAGRVINVYGPTETTVWSTSHLLGEDGGTVPIGRPVANTQIYVADERQRPLPIGAPGELLIGGDGVGNGYWRRPELTAERFVQTGCGRVYRTGDVVRLRNDGVLEFLGRIDNQVKIRGHRIELGEIEALLESAPGVRQAVVHPQEDAAGGKRLVAYVIPASGADFCREALRDFARKQLPEFMVPSVVEPLDHFPLTPNGKVDRKALPKPSVSPHAAAGGRRATAPVTETERKLSEVWQRLLETPEVGAADNFFELGGHSLLAMRAISEIEKTFGARLPTRMFLVSTLSQVASEIDRLTGGGQERGAVRLSTPRREAKDPARDRLGRVKRWFRKRPAPTGVGDADA